MVPLSLADMAGQHSLVEENMDEFGFEEEDPFDLRDIGFASSHKPSMAGSSTDVSYTQPSVTVGAEPQSALVQAQAPPDADTQPKATVGTEPQSASSQDQALPAAGLGLSLFDGLMTAPVATGMQSQNSTLVTSSSASLLLATPTVYQKEHFPSYRWTQDETSPTTLLFQNVRLPEKMDLPSHKSKEGSNTFWRYNRALLAPLVW